VLAEVLTPRGARLLQAAAAELILERAAELLELIDDEHAAAGYGPPTGEAFMASATRGPPGRIGQRADGRWPVVGDAAGGAASPWGGQGSSLVGMLTLAGWLPFSLSG
jgi:hypothetical protein